MLDFTERVSILMNLSRTSVDITLMGVVEENWRSMAKSMALVPF